MSDDGSLWTGWRTISGSRYYFYPESGKCALNVAMPIGDSWYLFGTDGKMQTYFSARYIRKEEPVPKKKTGAVLLTAGSIGPREKAESTAEMLLRQMSCDSLGTVYVNRTDKVPVRDREDIIQEIKDLAGRLRTAE